MDEIREGQKVRAVRDIIEDEFMPAGSIGKVTGVVDASKYGIGTLYSVIFFDENGNDSEPLLRRDAFEPI